MTVTVPPVTVAMPTEKEVEARSIRVVPGVPVIKPICTATMVVATVPPAAPIVDRFCCSTDAYADVLETGYWSCGGGSSEYAKYERSHRKRERFCEHALSFVFWPGVTRVATKHVGRH
jgi:hypothetical protein